MVANGSLRAGSRLRSGSYMKKVSPQAICGAPASSDATMTSTPPNVRDTYCLISSASMQPLYGFIYRGAKVVRYRDSDRQPSIVDASTGGGGLRLGGRIRNILGECSVGRSRRRGAAQEANETGMPAVCEDVLAAASSST